MVAQQVFNKAFAAVFVASFFGQAGQFQKLGYRTRRIMAQRTDTLSHAVNSLVQCIILPFKEKVHGMKIRAFNVPVGITGFHA